MLRETSTPLSVSIPSWLSDVWVSMPGWLPDGWACMHNYLIPSWLPEARYAVPPFEGWDRIPYLLPDGRVSIPSSLPNVWVSTPCSLSDVWVKIPCSLPAVVSACLTGYLIGGSAYLASHRLQALSNGLHAEHTGQINQTFKTVKNHDKLQVVPKIMPDQLLQFLSALQAWNK